MTKLLLVFLVTVFVVQTSAIFMKPVYIKIMDNKVLVGSSNRSLETTFLKSAMKAAVPVLAAASSSSSSATSLPPFVDSANELSSSSSDSKDKFEGAEEEKKDPVAGLIDYIITYTPELLPCLIKIANKHPQLLKFLSPSDDSSD